jgi:hypothetical protein
MFISPFAPDRWIDLWQLELVFTERSGILAELMKFLKTQAIVPVVAETCSVDSGERHKTTILCDCRDYKGGSLDCDLNARASRDRMELNELRAAIAVEFIGDLAFPNGVDPHISLVRNDGHFRAARLLDGRRRPPIPVEVERGTLALPKAIAQQIEGIMRVELAATRYLVISDSAERTLRVFFVPDSMMIAHVTASLHGPTPDLLTATLATLHGSGFDIVSSRLRFATYEHARPGQDRTRSRTFDLFLRPPDRTEWTVEGLSRVFEAISEEVSESTGHKLHLKYEGTVNSA